MSFQAPKAADLFADAGSAKKAAKLMDEYQEALNKSLGNPSSVPGAAPIADPASVMEALAANKSLSPDALAGLNNAIASQRLAVQEMQKDISLTSPLSTSFAAFDLEAPAKLLVPRPTPLRNRIPRKKGVGTSHRVKRVTGYTGTGTGGQGQIWPGVSESTTTAFGSINFERGPKISYTADDIVLPYNSYSLSDSVSFDANFSGLGYQDLRQLSSTSTLYATMLMEERMMLMARGTASGYAGALTAPSTPTTASPATSGSQTALAANTYYVAITADAGISGSGFGESALTAIASQVVGGGQVLSVTVPAAIVGALGYNVYVGTTNAAASLYFQGKTTGLNYVVQGAAASVGSAGNTGALKTTGAVATRAASDTSAYATGYDGILPTVLGANSGFINNIASTFSNTNPGVEFQQVFVGLYNLNKADPDAILINGGDRKQLSDSIKGAANANYRLNITQDELSGAILGSVVGGIVNEVTGKAVDLIVHPWLPQGVAPVISWTLPIPDTEVSDVWANYMVQDYMGIQWPVTQFAYEFSTYFRGTFFCVAPAWNGVVSGITGA
jgi:hypothetical protein